MCSGGLCCAEPGGVYLCMCVCVHSCMYACVCTHRNVSVKIYVYMRSCLQKVVVFLFMSACSYQVDCAELSQEVYVYVYMNMNMYVYVPTHTYIHTYTHTYIRARWLAHRPRKRRLEARRRSPTQIRLVQRPCGHCRVLCSHGKLHVCMYSCVYIDTCTYVCM